MKKWITLFILGFCFSFAYSGTLHVYEFYINGINTSLFEAIEDKNALNKNLDYYSVIGFKSNIFGNANSQIELLYNAKPSPIDDMSIVGQLIDVLNQKKAEGVRIEISTIVDTLMKIYGWTFNKESKEYQELTRTVKEKLIDIFAPNGANFESIADEFMHKSGLKALDSVAINDQKYFAIIAHSQGNLYANELANKYEHELGYHNFYLLGIATPASLVAGVDWSDAGYNPPIKRYVTSNKDLVINLIPSALPANTTQSVASQDNKNHSLSLTYLTDSALLKAIKMNYCLMISIIADYIRRDIPSYAANDTILFGISDPSYIHDMIFLERGIFYSVMQRLDPYSFFRGQIAVRSKNYSLIKTDYNFKADCIEWDKDFPVFCKRYKYRQVEEYDVFPNDDNSYRAGISYARYSNCSGDMNQTNNKRENTAPVYDELMDALIDTGYARFGTYILTTKFILE